MKSELPKSGAGPTTTGLWWGYSLVTSTLKGELSFAVRGICDALRGLPAVLHERRCVAKETVQVSVHSQVDSGTSEIADDCGLDCLNQST